VPSVDSSHAGLEPDHVARVVHEEYTRFEGRPIRDSAPPLGERFKWRGRRKCVAEVIFPSEVERVVNVV
jgi:hypothetical protein